MRRPAAVVLLTDTRTVRLLAPFFHGAHSLTTAAQALGRPTSTVAHWLPRFTAAGLLEELEPVRRAGAPIRRYRTVARTLVVPVEALPLDRRVALLDEGRYRTLRRFLDGLDEILAGEGLGGLAYQAAEDGGETSLSVTVDGQAAVQHWYDAWLELRLTPADAEAFARDLDTLVARYGGRRTGRTHLVHLGFAPLPRHRWRSAAD